MPSFCQFYERMQPKIGSGLIFPEKQFFLSRKPVVHQSLSTFLKTCENIRVCELLRLVLRTGNKIGGNC